MNELQADQPIFNGVVPEAQIALPAPAPKPTSGGHSIHPLLLGLCIFVANRVCPGLISTAWQSITALPSETERIATVLDEVLTAGKARDAQALYALFSTEAQSAVPLSHVENLVKGYNYAAFADYRELSITEINMTWGACHERRSERIHRIRRRIHRHAYGRTGKGGWDLEG